MDKALYCAMCGGVVSETDNVCPHCKKALPAKDRLFLNFLIDHTKDKIKGDIEDSVFETVKNYLLSHLFAVIVGFTMVVVAAAAVIFSSAADPYNHISKVDSIEQVRPAEDYSIALSAEDKAEIESMLQNYVSSLDDAKFMAGNDAYTYLISDELYFSLENQGGDYLYYNFYNDEENFPYVRAEDDPTNAITVHTETYNAKPDSVLAKELIGLEYRVASVDVTHTLYAGSTFVGERDYSVLLCVENGKWAIAETLER